MAESGREKDYKTTDPIAAANSTNNNEPVASEENYNGPGDSKAPTTTLESIVRRPNLYQSKSHATTTSAVSASDTESNTDPKKKLWYKNLNPLKWGTPPPVPQERAPSREYMAGFLSLMTFQWMAPLMTVSLLSCKSQSSIC